MPQAAFLPAHRADDRFQTMPLADLVRAARQAAEQTEHSHDGAAFELLRRAICCGCQDAWSTIISLYRPVVLAALRRHPARAVAGEADDYWVNRAFERFWSALNAERFERFASVGSLLKYLQLCAHSALLDELRVRGRAAAESLNSTSEGAVASASDEEATLGRLAASQLWQTITAELHDEPERIVTYLSLVRDLKPAQIQALHPAHFASPADVYRVKRNVLERLRRSPNVLNFVK
jgi:DNA-directed RNA polymerase specialized sigma24 family protein